MKKALVLVIIVVAISIAKLISIEVYNKNSFKSNDKKADSNEATITIKQSNKPEVINGYTLPPEPDPKINNATLLGIDSNNNGVRDDVERKIIKKFSKKLHIELMMDYVKIYQRILEHSIGDAFMLQKEISKVIDCSIYLGRIDSEIESDDWIENIDWRENIMFNTPQRVKKYLEYNSALSGGVFGSSPDDWNRDACSQNVIDALKEMGL